MSPRCKIVAGAHGYGLYSYVSVGSYNFSPHKLEPSPVFSPGCSGLYRGFVYILASTTKFPFISNAEDEWIDVTNDNPYKPNCMQLLVYLADSYYGYALKHYKQCEWTSQLMKVLQQNDVYAIHYIPYLDKYSIGKWIAYKNDNKILHAGIYTFAYRILDTKKREENEIIDYEWKKIGHNAIYYKAVSITSTKTIDMLIFPKNLEIMAYHYSPYYHDLLGFT